jgi:hypothetical protein
MFIVESSVGQVDINDGYESDESRRVFLIDEALSESDSDSSDSELGALATVGRAASRRQHCLPGCDCERPRGRKCGCERRGNGMCSESCQCNRQACRSRPDDDVSSSDGD